MRWNKLRHICFVLVLLITIHTPVKTEPVSENQFIFSQIKHDGEWDPYPHIWESILKAMVSSTSVQPWPNRRTLSLKEPILFDSPFIVITGKGPISFSTEERENLKIYLKRGGFLFIDDTDAKRNSPFAQEIFNEFSNLFPEKTWQVIPKNHAVFRSFYLIDQAVGRRIASRDLKGMWIQGRLSIIFSNNDLLGAWARDPLGQYLHFCSPGGERQRSKALQLTTNIIMLSLTGTYKTDAIHQPFLERKLRQ